MMTMHPRTKRLRKLMARTGLTAEDIARLLGRKTATVRIWRAPRSSRVIPEYALRLLELQHGASRK